MFDQSSNSLWAMPVDFPSNYLDDVLDRERRGAEATLGRALVAPYKFAIDCMMFGLGEALNNEAAQVDELDHVRRHGAA